MKYNNVIHNYNIYFGKLYGLMISISPPQMINTYRVYDFVFIAALKLYAIAA